MASDIGVTPAGGQPQVGVTGHAAGVRVYLHSPIRPYVAAVIRPLARSLAGERGATEIHLTAGWRFGPHLELRACPPEPEIDWHAVAATMARGARHFSAPSHADSQARYVRTAPTLGRIEAVAPPYLPCRPHGGTELVTAGRGRLDDLRRIGGSHLLAPLLDTAEATSPAAVLGRVAEAFLALTATHPHGMRFGTFSLRSHAEAFLHWAGPRADYRASFEARLEHDRPVLEELVRRSRDGSEGAGAVAWHRAFRACQDDFRGRVTEADLAEAPVGGGDREVEPSPFHAAVAASGVLDETPAWFAPFRVTINLFYGLLPALDVSPIQRFYLCYALAQSVDAVFDETWQDRLAAVASLLAAGA